MKTLKKNEKSWQTERHVYTKLIISLLQIVFSSTLGFILKTIILALILYQVLRPKTNTN